MLKLDRNGKYIYEEDLEEIIEIIEVEVTLEELKQQLNSTDYKIIKCYEYQLAGEDLPYDILALHSERQEIRDEINILEMELNQ